MNDITSKRVLWHCRRGMKELDLMLLPFCENCYETLSPKLQEDFQRLLDYSDPELFQWFLKAQEPDDPAMADMVERIHAFLSDRQAATNR